MATDTLFKQAPTIDGQGSDAPGWLLGVEATAAPAGQITAIWWAPSTGATGAVAWRVYAGAESGSGSLLGSGTLVGYVNDGTWQRFPITAIDVTAGQTFMVGYNPTNGDYAYSAGEFPVDDGVLSAVRGVFSQFGTRPDSTSTLLYQIDVEYTYSASIDATLNASAPAATASSTVGQRVAGTVAATAPAAAATSSVAQAVAVTSAAAAPAAMAALAVGLSVTATAVASAPAATAVLTVGAGASTVVPRPATGTITRPDDGLIQVPTRTYP